MGTTRGVQGVKPINKDYYYSGCAYIVKQQIAQKLYIEFYFIFKNNIFIVKHKLYNL